MKVGFVLVVVVAVALVAGVAVMGLMAQPSKMNGQVSLILDKTELRGNERTITYTIVNNSGEKISFGAMYDVQIRRDGEWVRVDWIRDRVWILVLYMLEPGQSFDGVVELPDDVEVGTYRVLKEISFEETGRKMVLEAKFQVLG